MILMTMNVQCMGCIIFLYYDLITFSWVFPLSRLLLFTYYGLILIVLLKDIGYNFSAQYVVNSCILSKYCVQM